MLTLLFALAALAAPTTAPAEVKPVGFPLETGRSWTFSGEVRWIGKSGRLSEGPARCSITIEKVRARGEVKIAKVRGWFTDCLRPRPVEEPRTRYLVEVEGQGLWLLEPSDALALALDGQGPVSPGPLGLVPQDLRVVPDLKTGLRFGNDPEYLKHKDGLYVTEVTGEPTMDLTGVGLGKKKGFELTSRALPDRLVLGFVPGVGFVSCDYAHHGIVEEGIVKECKVKLVELKKGAGK